MKRHKESSEDEREPKRAKIEQQNDEDPLLPPEILQKILQYACHEDLNTASLLLQSAKLFADVLSEENWKLLYVLRWHRKILGEDGDNYSNEEIISEIEQHLSVEPNDYVDKRFYENNAWKNRYKYRSQLESEGRRVPDQDLSCQEYQYEVDSRALVFYKLENDERDIRYSNLAKIFAKNNSEMDPPFSELLHDSSSSEDVYHAILIARTGAPVKVRLEKLDGAECGNERYFNTRLLGYNWKNQIWDIIVAHFSNFEVEEDEIDYYKPYYIEFTKAFFVEKKNVSNPPDEKYEEHDICDLFRIICAAAQVSEEHVECNIETYVDLDTVILEERDREFDGSEERVV